MDGDRGADDDGQQAVWEPVSQCRLAGTESTAPDEPDRLSGDSSASADASVPADPSVSGASSASGDASASADPSVSGDPSVSRDSCGSSASVDGDVPSEFVAGLFARLDAVLEDLADVRYPAMAPGEVRAAVRGLYARVARVQAQALRSLAAVDDRDDVIPTARPGKAAATFAQHALGLGPGKAAREAATGRLLDGQVGDLKVVGAGLAAGWIGRDKVEVCVSAHAALGSRVREEVDTLFGQSGRRIDLIDALLAAKAVRAGMSTPELAAFAADLVAELNPKPPAGAHERP